MDPETKRLLEETHALARDNHRMLKAIRRDWWFGLIARVVIWAIVLLLPLYLYQQYIQPLIEQYVPASARATPNILGLPSIDYKKLIDSYKAGKP